MNDGPEGREKSGVLGAKTSGKTARSEKRKALSKDERRLATRARKKKQREVSRTARDERRDKRLSNAKR